MEFGLQQFVPALVAVAALVNIFRIAVIAEQLYCLHDVPAIGAAAASAVVHAFGLAHIAHQPRHGIDLLRVGVTAVAVQHVVPVKGDGLQLAEVHLQGSGRIGRNRGRGLGGILPVVEDHRQRCGGTTGQAVRSPADRALVVIRVFLIPHRGEQRLDARRGARCRLVQGALHLQLGMRLQVFHILLVAVKPVAHVAGQVGHVNRAVTVGKHLLGTVVTGDDDIGVAGVEDIVYGLISVD